mmetsp:Transcript_11928/g.17783  ORF Transcript_11928/g.17783 Transcript_11928/m.17783 type:complete len:109 (+) Transcript_11928:35-361(+)
MRRRLTKEEILRMEKEIAEREERRSLMLEVSLSGNIPAIVHLLENKCDIELNCRRGNTPMHFAAIGGHLVAMKFLFENNARIDPRNYDGNTPMHVAASYGHKRTHRLR